MLFLCEITQLSVHYTAEGSCVIDDLANLTMSDSSVCDVVKGFLLIYVYYIYGELERCSIATTIKNLIAFILLFLSIAVIWLTKEIMLRGLCMGTMGSCTEHR